jgi:hypothetical protein
VTEQRKSSFALKVREGCYCGGGKEPRMQSSEKTGFQAGGTESKANRLCLAPRSNRMKLVLLGTWKRLTIISGKLDGVRQVVLCPRQCYGEVKLNT